MNDFSRLRHDQNGTAPFKWAKHIMLDRRARFDVEMLAAKQDTIVKAGGKATEQR
jgi:hypothetical protein